MEFEDHAELHEEEELEEEEDEGEGEEEDDEMATLGPMAAAASYDLFGNINDSPSSSRPKTSTAAGSAEQPPPELDATATTRSKYRECLKNQAVGIGGHALDGCGEFLPAGPDGSIDAFRCAACSCHRNFHRRENGDTTSSSSAAAAALLFRHHHHLALPAPPTPRPPPPHLHHLTPQFAPFRRSTAASATAGGGGHKRRPPPLALPSTTAASDQEAEGGSSGGGGRKRFRTKFTAEQKGRMLELAERLGWRIQKHDEAAVQQFCEETGLRRQVLKVWMHNNKHTLGGGSPSVVVLPNNIINTKPYPP